MYPDHEGFMSSELQMQPNLYFQTKANSSSMMGLQQKYQNLFLFKSLKLAISISLISVFISYLIGGNFSVFQHFNIYSSSFYGYFSTFLLSRIHDLHSYTLDRNYMFLLCNVILVFLAGYRSFTTSSPSSSSATPHSQVQEPADNKIELDGVADMSVSQPDHENYETLLRPNQEDGGNFDADQEPEGDAIMSSNGYETGGREQDGITEEEGVNEGQEDVNEEQAQGALVMESVDNIGEELDDVEGKETDLDSGSKEANMGSCEILTTIGDGEGDDLLEEASVASTSFIDTEELNNKFEEFIRKMKEELRLEAQRQQLIAA